MFNSHAAPSNYPSTHPLEKKGKPPTDTSSQTTFLNQNQNPPTFPDPKTQYPQKRRKKANKQKKKMAFVPQARTALPATYFLFLPHLFLTSSTASLTVHRGARLRPGERANAHVRSIERHPIASRVAPRCFSQANPHPQPVYRKHADVRVPHEAEHRFRNGTFPKGAQPRTHTHTHIRTLCLSLTHKARRPNSHELTRYRQAHAHTCLS